MRNNNFLPKETVLRIIDSPRTKKQMVNMIKCIPEVEAVEIKEGATNGDMIKAMFPNQHSDAVDRVAIIDLDGYVVGEIDTNWWNAPYKAESEDKK